jgi:hypothetical protein
MPRFFKKPKPERGFPLTQLSPTLHEWTMR